MPEPKSERVLVVGESAGREAARLLLTLDAIALAGQRRGEILSVPEAESVVRFEREPEPEAPRTRPLN